MSFFYPPFQASAREKRTKAPGAIEERERGAGKRAGKTGGGETEQGVHG